MALFTPASEFVLVAKVSAPLKAVYDVAALVLYEDAHTWAKLCYEMSPEKKTTVVSVVTRGVSDDTNSFTVEGGFVYLAIARRGSECSFHASTDGKTWTLIRHFQLTGQGRLRAGFAVHGSVGDGLAGTFSEIRYAPKAPAKMRVFRLDE
jgi:regulation of enolase protein 1 (concanavalin A-like superfamily)